jgi:hypothetical protein
MDTGTALGIAQTLGADGSTFSDAERMAFAAGLGTALWLGAAVLATTGAATWALAPHRPTNDPRWAEPS